MEDSKLIIYNAWLRASAEAKNRGYRKKKDPDFSKEKEGILDTLDRFFAQYKHIQPYIFFKASYEIMGTDFIPLDFFKKQKAIKYYSDYVKMKYDNSADSDEAIKSFKEGIVFINNFTKEHSLRFLEYPNIINNVGVPYFIIHLQEQNITFYHIHLLGIKYDKFPEDYREIICENFDKMFLDTQQKYLDSIKMKEIGNALMGRLK